MRRLSSCSWAALSDPFLTPTIALTNKSNDVGYGKVSASSSGFQFRSADSFLSSINNKSNSDVDLTKYRAGVTVYHKKFGEGVITEVEAEEDDLKVDIEFSKVGHKRLMAKFANLEVIN